jgi:hypothetical protein
MADPTSTSGLVGDANAAPASASLTGNTPAGTFIGTSSSVASNADYVGGVNVANENANILKDPTGYLGTEGNLSANVTTINPNNPDDVVNKNDYFMDVDGLQGSASTGAVAQASQVTKPTQAATYDAVTTGSQVDTLNRTTNAAQGAYSAQAEVNVDTFDMQGLATGVNEDGSKNEVGEAFNTVYTQNISNIVDTSTVSGKLLAQRLGEGNYTDAKTQVTWQLEELSKDFVDANGNPTIPPYAASAVKGVERLLAFKGVTGTAAIAAVASATMESLLPIATAQAQFFQTTSLKNLDAKNTQALNTANILSKMNVTDLDARMTAAVTNAKNFMTYDLTNLDNEQQMTVLKYQGKQQSILEDAKQKNVARQFGAEATNRNNEFYDQLGANIDQFNVAARNNMTQFNTGEVNSMEKFNLEIENMREQFYMNFQKDIDESTAKWRQTVSLTNNQVLNEAAATDVKNVVNMTTEAMNRMWDRTDSLLDYAWKEGENEKDRRLQVQVAKINYDAKVAASQDNSSPFGKIAGTIAGGIIGSATGPIGGAIGKSITESMFGP